MIDTNVIIAGLRSNRGASYRLLSLIGTGKFQIHDSVPLILEYEEVLQDQKAKLGLTRKSVDNLIDYLCAQANHHKIFFLWRPTLPDPYDELILELAVAGRCEFIVTHNLKDFSGSEQFGIRPITPGEFLRIIGEV